MATKILKDHLILLVDLAVQVESAEALVDGYDQPVASVIEERIKSALVCFTDILVSGGYLEVERPSKIKGGTNGEISTRLLGPLPL